MSSEIEMSTFLKDILFIYRPQPGEPTPTNIKVNKKNHLTPYLVSNTKKTMGFSIFLNSIQFEVNKMT